MAVEIVQCQCGRRYDSVVLKACPTCGQAVPPPESIVQAGRDPHPHRRSDWLWSLGIGSALCAVAAFFAAGQSNAANAMNGPGSGSGARALMWVLSVVAVGLLIALIIVATNGPRKVIVVSNTTHVTLVPGWYDDPQSPLRLRYWDGQQWTDRTAEKS